MSAIYGAADNYQVLIEFDPHFANTADPLNLVTVRSESGVLVPLSSFATIERTASARSISQLGQRPAMTISFDTSAGTSLGEAVDRINALKLEEGFPQL